MAIATSALAALAIGQTLQGYYSNIGAAKAAKAQGEYEGSILDTNASFADSQARDAEARGMTEEQRHKAAVRQLIGGQRAAIGASGVALDSGSALDVQLESASMGAMDELTIRNNAAREAWGYKVQAADLRNRGKLARMGASNQAQSYKNAGYSTLLTGAAAVGSIYRKR